jgi:hypothetical protein
MVVGAHTASVNNVNGQAVQIVVQTRSCTASTGTWTANLALGTATVTVTTQSATGVSGSFTGTLEPGAGTGAVGTKSISGTFNATF